MKHNSFLGISEEGFHNIAYTEWGASSPELPTVICVHGYTRNGRDFDKLAYYLSNQGEHVFCPDIVGRGNSSWLKNSHHYNFTQYVNDMNALIARTGAKKIDWVGTSMGGLIGMMLAALPDSPIRRLVLNDIGPQIPLQGLKRLGKYAGHEPDFKSFNEAKHYFKACYADFGITSEEDWDHLTEHSIEQRVANLYSVKLDPKIKNPKSTLQTLSDFFHHPHKTLEGVLYDIDLWSVWNNIRCPVLVIHGLQSDLLTSDIVSKMKRTHESVDIYALENVGHAPALLNIADQEIIYAWLRG